MRIRTAKNFITGFLFAAFLSIASLHAAFSQVKCLQECSLRIVVTTTFEDSGLAPILLEEFSKQTGIETKIIVVGTGEALNIAKRGEADVVLVNSTSAELNFIQEGYALERQDIMYNDFVIVGPNEDPAQVALAKTAAEAYKKIYDNSTKNRTLFVSRGDASGTHNKELEIWQNAKLSPKGHSFYREAVTGMVATLNLAASMEAYTMTDRGTWLKFHNKKNLKIVFSGDLILRNQYGLLILNPEKNNTVNMQGAFKFRNWIISPKGQKAIADYHINGEPAFIPNAIEVKRPLSASTY